MSKIILFASGSGTNVENIVKYFAKKDVEIVCIYTNNPNAFVIKRAQSLNIQCKIIDRDNVNSGKLLEMLMENKPDLIVLAGYLWLIPNDIISEFHNKIINIHPALLPKYGGKGMYGAKVHQSVIENNESESGITIHYVNSKYDEGNIIFQAKCPVQKQDTPEMLAENIHSLEHKYYPVIIEQILLDFAIQD